MKETPVIAVFGANGQLGSDLCRTIKARIGPCLPIVRADIDLSKRTAEDVVSELWKYEFDILINCTAFHNVEACHKDPEQALRINGHMVGVMAKTCAIKGRKFVQISTDYVFGFNPDRDIELNKGFAEWHMPAPINVYGMSKLFGESLALAQAGKNAHIIRVAGLFGTTPPSGKKGNFVDNMIARIMNGESIRVVDDQIVSPTSTRDAANAIVSLVLKPYWWQLDHITHISNNTPLSWYEFTLLIEKHAPQKRGARITPVKTIEMLTGVQRSRFSALNASRIVERWHVPMPTLDEALQAYMTEKYVK